MMESLHSLASEYPKPVDCRQLYLEINFYQMTRAQCDILALQCYDWINQMLQKCFVSDWYVGERHAGNRAVREQLASCKDAPSFSFEAYALSDVVYNKKTFRDHERRLETDPCSVFGEGDYSCDYPSIYRGYLQNPPQSEEAWKKLVMQLFYEPDRKKVAVCRDTDFWGLFSCSPYFSDETHFHGTVMLGISSVCLGSRISEFANRWASFAADIGLQHKKLNACVMLTSVKFSGPHFVFFGARPEDGGSHLAANCQPVEWYPFYYLKDAQWFQYVSPLARIHLPNVVSEAKAYPEILVNEVEGGGLCVRLKKEIDQVDVLDLMPMRKLLFKALFPGSKEYMKNTLLEPERHFNWKIRKDWELLPIFPEEFSILEDRIVFHHKI